MTRAMPGPMPRTRMSASSEPNAPCVSRSATIRCASAGPMRGRRSIVRADARSMSIGAAGTTPSRSGALGSTGALVSAPSRWMRWRDGRRKYAGCGAVSGSQMLPPVARDGRGPVSAAARRRRPRPCGGAARAVDERDLVMQRDLRRGVRCGRAVGGRADGAGGGAEQHDGAEEHQSSLFRLSWHGALYGDRGARSSSSPRTPGRGHAGI